MVVPPVPPVVPLPKVANPNCAPTRGAASKTAEMRAEAENFMTEDDASISSQESRAE